MKCAVIMHMEKPPFVQKGSEWRSKRAYHPLKRSSDDVNGCVVMHRRPVVLSVQFYSVSMLHVT